MRGNWSTAAPVWCSRPRSDGVVSSFNVSLWLFMLIGYAILLNVIVWPIIGLVEAAQWVVHAL